jgi:hypothetical protein
LIARIGGVARLCCAHKEPFCRKLEACVESWVM